MKYAHVFFTLLLISLGYMIWDYNNVGTLCFVFKYNALYFLVVALMIILGLWRGHKILSNCVLSKLFVTFIFSFAIMVMIGIFLSRIKLMKKDIAIMFTPIYMVLLGILIIPTKKKPLKLSYKYFIPEIFVLFIFTIYVCFRSRLCLAFDFFSMLFIYSIGMLYFICVLLLFIFNKNKA